MNLLKWKGFVNCHSCEWRNLFIFKQLRFRDNAVMR